jgi:hypothetical protein
MATDPRYFGLQFPTFQRAMRNILSITPNGQTTTIVTTFDGQNPGVNQFGTGLIVRLFIPQGWGMQQLNGFYGPITVIDTTSFSVAIDSTNFDPLVIPSYQPGFLGTPPQVIPVGEVNTTLTEATQNVLPYP